MKTIFHFAKKIVMEVYMFSKRKFSKIVCLVLSTVMVATLTVGCGLENSQGKLVSGTEVKNGLSAYEIAVQYGYEGTIEEWLKSLNGKSAFEIAKENGYTGNQEEWIAAINAAASHPVAGITTAKFSSKGELIIVLSDGTELNVGKAVGKDGKNGIDGVNGINGKDGSDGSDGRDGKDGVSISGVSVNESGQMVITYSDGKSVNLDKIVAANGKDGIGISKSEINTAGELVLTYSNGQQANLGCIIGADGQNGKDGVPGKDGVDGKDGISITNSVINNAGELVLTYSNGTNANLGKVVGANGKDGVNGTNGVNGTDGKDGVDGKDGIGVTTAEINSEGELVLTFSNGQD